jgi:hypothetical protein
MNKCNQCGTENPDNAKYCRNCGYELPKPQEPIIQETIPAHTIPQAQKKLNQKTITGIIVGTIFLVVMYFAAQFLVQKLNTPSFDETLVKMASELNKTLPIIVDSDTRLDNVTPLPQKVFQYNYTLINADKVSVDTLELKNYLEPRIINFYQTSPDMQFQRENKITVNYQYKDKVGNYLFMISVKPK